MDNTERFFEPKWYIIICTAALGSFARSIRGSPFLCGGGGEPASPPPPHTMPAEKSAKTRSRAAEPK